MYSCLKGLMISECDKAMTKCSRMLNKTSKDMEMKFLKTLMSIKQAIWSNFAIHHKVNLKEKATAS